MPLDRPFHRTVHQFSDGTYDGSGRWIYLQHPKYAETPEHYIRSFLLLQKDLVELFDYVEPADANQNCYSYRIHSLLLRACVEVEANCKAILKENGYARQGAWTINDYKKIEASHRLSSYEIVLPQWAGAAGTRTPFSAWKAGTSPEWYKAYNATKHDRHVEFKRANFENLVDAFCGVLVLLSAQFYTNDFSDAVTWVRSLPRDGSLNAIGGRFRVRFPSDWLNDDRYDFDWSALEREADPFQNFDYS